MLPLRLPLLRSLLPLRGRDFSSLHGWWSLALVGSKRCSAVVAPRHCGVVYWPLRILWVYSQLLQRWSAQSPWQVSEAPASGVQGLRHF